MAERLKSWESPRKRGRNDKGKGGTARARQLRKREKLLRKKLKQNQHIQAKKQRKSQEGEIIPPLFFCSICIRSRQKLLRFKFLNPIETNYRIIA